MKLKFINKIKEIKNKKRLKYLLKNCKVDINLFIRFKEQDEGGVLDYIKEFINVYSKEIKSIPLVINIPQDHLIIDDGKKTFKELIKEVSPEMRPKLNKSKYGYSIYSRSIICVRGNLENEKRLSEKFIEFMDNLKKNEPKNLKIELEVHTEFIPCEKFTKDDAKLLIERGNLTEISKKWLETFYLNRK